MKYLNENRISIGAHIFCKILDEKTVNHFHIPPQIHGRVLNMPPIKCQCCPHIETSQLICCANQVTGFYMRATFVFNLLRQFAEYFLQKSRSE